MVCASGGGREAVEAELAGLEAEWAELMAAIARPGDPLVGQGAWHSGGGAALRAAESKVRDHERRAAALQDRIAALAAGRPDEPVILARMLKRIGDQRGWDTEDLPPALVRRLIETVAGAAST
jgi:hypothetical protein